ncbi:hypothetical protein FFK22_029755 [Mycobacterium sp. KBS0706]|uniref:hypothetical protein n=1 Tax=Mycobacterium sp. KBS0706 TaxID=2578109 RepID=UPI00117E84AD|nr:hypothetical protein [Mycobacterium sp. KBS0706]TSD85016.1 hypothetical protein FFK22_029755 [Mycobacterium sp. KBS0706]
MLFALLLAIVAPTVDAPFTGSEFGNCLSEPDDPQGDAAILVNATLSVAEDPEEEAAREDATFLALAGLPCAAGADYRATDAWRPSIPRPSAHPCTGPPML